jgi:hypothetical protein
MEEGSGECAVPQEQTATAIIAMRCTSDRASQYRSSFLANSRPAFSHFRPLGGRKRDPRPRSLDSVVQMHDTRRMNTFVPLRDWSAKTGALLRQLQKSGTLIVTQNGVPAAYVIKANPENIEADMAALNRLRFTQVTQAMRASAKAAGVDKMSLKAINAEIAGARAARR